MLVAQSAGTCGVRVYTDGSPLWPEITITASNGEVHVVRVDAATLHDLQYCIGRVLKQIEPQPA